MKKWSTKIFAKAPQYNGEVREFTGPLIEAPTKKLAQEYCYNNGLGYCYVHDECVAVSDDNDGYIDFETTQHN